MNRWNIKQTNKHQKKAWLCDKITKRCMCSTVLFHMLQMSLSTGLYTVQRERPQLHYGWARTVRWCPKLKCWSHNGHIRTAASIKTKRLMVAPEILYQVCWHAPDIFSIQKCWPGSTRFDSARQPSVERICISITTGQPAWRSVFNWWRAYLRFTTLRSSELI